MLVDEEYFLNEMEETCRETRKRMESEYRVDKETANYIDSQVSLNSKTIRVGNGKVLNITEDQLILLRRILKTKE